MNAPLGVRWTIGDVSAHGFRALRLSILGARKLFGPRAAYLVCVNSVPVDVARARTGTVPDEVLWRDTTDALHPLFRQRVDDGMAEGMAWKFAPLRAFPDRFELALDNDCILWRIPDALRAWLSSTRENRCVLAEDVRPSFGRFAHLLGREPRNAGIRGVPPSFDLEAALRAVLAENPDTLTTELDEQGLQVAAVSRGHAPLVVRTHEVSICSPFPPHLPNLGTCGAHFVGLNARSVGWKCEGRPGEDLLREHFERLVPEVEELVEGAGAAE